MPIHPLRKKNARSKRAEAKAKTHYKNKGYTIHDTHKGSDFVATKNGRKTHVEVKAHHPDSKDHRPGSANRTPHHPHLTQAQYNKMKQVRNDGKSNTSYRIWYG